MIGQAHLDPVWLWGWQAGLDEALATCRSACDLLDAYPDFIFTRGEAWSYAQVERVDPALFARIRAHVAAGRWEIVGGWWLQPDCNFPSGIGMARQISTGKDYFLDRFGVFPEIGYNVDSFGHMATLPGMMHAAGQRYYVMMRPQEHEMWLPARLFRWRGTEDGPEITTFRIGGQYNTGGEDVGEWLIRRATEALPAGITDTMCFYGVGDHGGGPTARLIEWIAAHQESFEGCRLVFSSPSRFFAAVAGQTSALPLVTGELQHHAIGCYTVMRPIKTGIRAAEQRLRQAEVLGGVDAGALTHAWQQVCFAQFHDICGGTCIPSAYPAVLDQLAGARAVADEALTYGLRERMLALPDAPAQRIVLYNASDEPFDDYVEFAPWTQGRWEPNWRLLDADGRPTALQRIPSEAVAWDHPNFCFRARLAANTLGSWTIDPHGDEAPAEPPMSVLDGWIATAQGASVDLLGGWLGFPDAQPLPLPRLALLTDLSDNWSHNLDRYPEGPVVSPVWHAPSLLHHGPLLTSLLQLGAIGDSTLRAEWRLYADRPGVELRLTVHWREERKLLKLIYALADSPAERVDGIGGGSLARPNDGKERPLQDWTLAGEAGIVCPDVYALDGLPWRLRFTLLRSPVMAHHEPNLGMAPHAVFADQGVYQFRFRFYAGEAATAERLRADSQAMQRPLLAADLTRGMPRNA